MDKPYASRLERLLREGHFVVTAEVGPPKNADLEVIRKKGALVRDVADACDITDNQTAIVRMSSLASAKLLLDMGIEPIMQMTCRDRNRIAMQSDLLGAHALGIRNILCLSGDHMKGGNHPQAREVYDVDSVNLVKMVHGMSEGKFQNGEALTPAPDFFVGAVKNPFAPPYEFRPYRLKKKIEAGAKFVQTQMVFNLPRFREFMQGVCDLGLDRQVYVLAGVGPLKSPGMGKYMRDNVPGLDVPEELIRRMDKTPKDQYRAEGCKICAETIQQLREIRGVAGIHVMSIEWEESVPRIVEAAGLLPRPRPWESKTAPAAISQSS